MRRNVVLGLVAAVSVAVCAFLLAVLFRQGLAQAGLWAAPLGTVAGVVAAVAAVWALPRPSKVLLPPEQVVPEWVIERPVELAAVVKALVSRRAGMVGITTGLSGAGGFGKTTLARMVCADERVQRQFRGRVYLVTVGRDVRGAAAIAARVNDVIKLVAGEDATFTNPEDAGRRLGSVLDVGPRRLLVLDDVWQREQLVAFTEGGRQCARLVTTRMLDLLGPSLAVRVDQMTPEQARALLTSGLPPLDPAVSSALLEVTGRWPLLLRLVNRLLAECAGDVSERGAELLEQLRSRGPAAVDAYLGDVRGLDVGQPAERSQAVRVTIGASTGLLDRPDADRFEELSVFAEDEVMPFGLVARLWRATSGLDSLQAAQVCKRLAQLALVSQVGPAGSITMHDVVRQFVREELGEQRLAHLNGRLLEAVAANLPPLHRGALRRKRVAWWELGDEDRYLWDHLIEHLVNAGRRDEAETIASDLRWVGARLQRFGPAAPAADLSAVGTPRAIRLRAVLARAAHLLAPTEPARAVVDVLHSRVADDPEWGSQVTALAGACPRPRLANRWPLPDLPVPALRRVITGHTGQVAAMAVAPDSSWLASGSRDGTVRIWDAATGREKAALAGHPGGVRAVAVAPGGSWLASGGADGLVRIWDAATGREKAALAGHPGGVRAVAVAPDSSWLASGGADGLVRIWDAATGREKAALTGHATGVTAIAVAPDSSWLASGGADGLVRIWDADTGRERSARVGHTFGVAALAVAPDGSWLASGGGDGLVRIWNTTAGRERSALTGHATGVTAIAVAPDGSWLASGGGDGLVRIWDATVGRERSALVGHTRRILALVVAPDGSWLVSGSADTTARIWDLGSTRRTAALGSHTPGVTALAVAPDGSWLASGSADGMLRIWDAASGRERSALVGHTPGVTALAVAPDGSWLACGTGNGTVQIWDIARTAILNPLRSTRWDRSDALARHNGEVAALVVAPDGSWLASGSADGTVRIWDMATRRDWASLASHAGGVMALAAATDGSWLASGGGDGTVRIWDMATRRQRASLVGHADGVMALAAAGDGSWLASGGGDGTVRIWDVAAGQERESFAGHTGVVTALAAAPDDVWLASGGSDGTVRIWEVATGRTQAFMRLENSVNASAWLSANVLAVGSSAGPHLFDFLTGIGPATARR